MTTQTNTNTNTNTTNVNRNTNKDIAGQEVQKAVDMALDAQRKGEGAQVLMTHAIYLRVRSGDMARHSLMLYAGDKMDKAHKAEFLDTFLAKNNKRCEQLLDLLDKDSDAYQAAGENKRADARKQMTAIKQMTRRALMTAAYLLDTKAEDVKVTRQNKLQYTTKDEDGQKERDVYSASQVAKQASAHFRPTPAQSGNRTNAGQGETVDTAADAIAQVPLRTLCEMTAKRIRGVGGDADKLNAENKAAAQELLCELLALFAAKDESAEKIDGRKVQAIYKAAANGQVAA